MTATYQAIIIGAGFAGIGMGIQLRRAGMTDFLILEQGADIGGTWRDNTYPGAACDVESHLYSLSFAPKRDWSNRYAGQAEINAYLHQCIANFKLMPHIKTSASVTALEFSEALQLWTVTLASGEQLQAQSVITAVGQLNQPKYPSLTGVDQNGETAFAGPAFHSSRWQHGVELDNKRVGVIGTGASAIQFVPQIAQLAKQVRVFQRSPAWVIPKQNTPFKPWQLNALRYVPGLAKLYRALIYLKNEARALAFTKFGFILKVAEFRAKKMARKAIHDPQLYRRVIPTYRAGCNRILLANDWFSTLAKPHVAVETTAIAAITPTGVTLTTGEQVELDVLIFGTGFRATEFLQQFDVIGRNGKRLQDAWRQGAEAYKGISVHGFPNLFMLYGPNTNLSHSSVLIMLEAQMHYVRECLRLLESERQQTMEVTAAAQQHDVEQLQQKLKHSVWASGCSSWYLNDSGRNVVNWFGFTFTYKWRTKRVRLADYEFTPQ